MTDTELEKRYRGLHFEAGQLPDFLLNSASFKKLPLELRQLVYVATSPRSVRNVHKLRSLKSENLDSPSLKPFVDTKSIFVHIPKSAGISVGFSLYGRKTGDHRTIDDYKLCFTRHEFRSYFKFTFVRNPWDRLVSTFLYLKQGGRNERDHDWFQKHLSLYGSFSDFVTNWLDEDNIQLGLHFRPQYEFLSSRGLKPEVDFIGYFENIVDDYGLVRGRLGVGKELEALNKTAKRNKGYRDYYNGRTREIVRRVYRNDIETFGYTFDNSSLSDQLAKRSL